MKVYQELAPVNTPQGFAVTIGVFDGVHLGHQHLFQQLKQAAREHGCGTAVVTFRNHPDMVLHTKSPVRYLTTLEERVRLLQKQGIDLVVPITFDKDLSRLRAREFVALLQERLRLRCLVVGPDFALGHRREGDIAALQAIGKEQGFRVDIAEPLVLLGQVVSSTAIRQALAEGEVELAASMLGRPFGLEGAVGRGAGRGQGLGFPTANLELDADLALPRYGIYATWTEVNNTRLPSATSVGVRPTFDGSRCLVETHILDFQGDLYRRRIRLEFVRRLRDEIRFDSVEALVRQMREDVNQTRTLLSAAQRASI